ncbi:MAG: HAD family phosphatase, partial [Candidatus Daviesbacteria bacterium]|nr:HAD family phosphatase [Candidatus Daviesbacteria bacterium]
AGKCLNIPIPQEFLHNQKGMTDEAGAKLLLGEKFNEHGKKFVQIKQAYTVKNCAIVKLLDGFPETLEQLTEKGIKAWICTSAHKEFITAVFNSLPQLQILADKTVFREMYTHGKPNPEPILLTAKLMGLDINDCIYVGDAYNDYLAATAAGAGFTYVCKNPRDKDARIPVNIPVISNHTQILSSVSEI